MEDEDIEENIENNKKDNKMEEEEEEDMDDEEFEENGVKNEFENDRIAEIWDEGANGIRYLGGQVGMGRMLPNSAFLSSSMNPCEMQIRFQTKAEEDKKLYQKGLLIIEDGINNSPNITIEKQKYSLKLLNTLKHIEIQHTCKDKNEIPPLFVKEKIDKHKNISCNQNQQTQIKLNHINGFNHSHSKKQQPQQHGGSSGGIGGGATHIISVGDDTELEEIREGIYDALYEQNDADIMDHEMIDSDKNNTKQRQQQQQQQQQQLYDGQKERNGKIFWEHTKELEGGDDNENTNTKC